MALVVVGRLGVMASDPAELYDALTEHLDADQMVPAEIHEDLFGPGDRGNTEKRYAVDQAMLARAHATLEAGRSVVFDAYLNNPAKRTKVVEMAESVGATAVLIHPRARMPDIIKRVKLRYAGDEADVPSEGVTVSREVRIARQMMAYVLRDDINPDTNDVPHLCVDGMLPVEEIVPKVDEYLERLRRAS